MDSLDNANGPVASVELSSSVVIEMPSSVVIEMPSQTNTEVLSQGPATSDDDDSLSVTSEQTIDDPSVQHPICSRRQKARYGVSCFVGVVCGWCIMAVIALGNTSQSEIEGICGGCKLWELLGAMIGINIVCTFTLVHIWYYHHFHRVRVYAHTNTVIHLVIAVQVIITVWGASVLLSRCPRENLQHLLIYTVTYVWIIWQLFIILIIVLMSLCICIAFSSSAL